MSKPDLQVRGFVLQSRTIPGMRVSPTLERLLLPGATWDRVAVLFLLHTGFKTEMRYPPFLPRAPPD